MHYYEIALLNQQRREIEAANEAIRQDIAAQKQTIAKASDTIVHARKAILDHDATVRANNDLFFQLGLKLRKLEDDN